ncbi:VWA domain-containing protein [Aquincola sp. MAHUQ-54]|uniref:VWA domain-containing protein n=1 Tax=Aquincola agrisoli TaxID=3119538 RepID=A0AAW9QEM6_9BURK
MPTLIAKGATPLQREHLQWRTAVPGGRRLHCIVLDGSASMRRAGGLARAKGLADRLIADAAQAGDAVAVLGLNGQGVQWLLQARRARGADTAGLQRFGTGGGTPLRLALAQAQAWLQQASQRRAGTERWLWLLTDGRTLDTPARPTAAEHIVIVDFDDPRHPLGRAAAWAVPWGATHCAAAELDLQRR